MALPNAARAAPAAGDGPRDFEQLGGPLDSPVTATPPTDQRPAQVDAASAAAMRKALLRELACETLEPVARHSEAARLMLEGADDVAARYHLGVVVAAARAAARAFRELEDIAEKREARS